MKKYKVVAVTDFWSPKKLAQKSEKVLNQYAEEGWELCWPFIAGKVKKTLKSVGTSCDAGNYVIFYDDGGYIVHRATRDYIRFERVGNVYVIDVWVRIGSQADRASSGFARQG